MTNRFRASAALLAALVGGVAASANAEVIATVTYHDLSGSFAKTSTNTGNFTAVAVNTNNLQSAYEASRLVPAAGSAAFEAGFVSNPLNPADFVVNVSVTRLSNTLALGSGNFTVTDRDGDTITGDIINGVWTSGGPGFIFLNANLTNVRFNDNGALDGAFNGTAGGSFLTSFVAQPPFSGSMTQLVFGASNFFTQSFSDRATGGSFQIVPSPGSMALVGIGGLMVASRRRGR